MAAESGLDGLLRIRGASRRAALLVPAGHPLAARPAASLAEVAGERWIQGWGDVGDVTDMLAALSGMTSR